MPSSFFSTIYRTILRGGERTTAINPIRNFRFELEIFSEASKSGWGACCRDESTHRFWKPSERKLHINYLALIAIWMSLKFCEGLGQLRNPVAITLRRSRTSTVWGACNTRVSTKQHAIIGNGARQGRFGSSRCTYIASKENDEADRESRAKNIDTEWELSDATFYNIEFWAPNNRSIRDKE